MTSVTGNTKDCLKHFMKSQKLDAFIAHCGKRFGISHATARGWYNRPDGPRPTGIRMIQVQIILVERGYQLVELVKAPDVLLQARVFFAQGDLSMSELKSALRLSEVTIGRLLQLTGTLTEDSKVRLERLLRQKFNGAAKQIVKKPQSTALVRSTDSQSRDAKSTLAMAAMHIKALLPLVEYLASDAATPDDRRELRRLSGGDGIPRLKNGLAMVSSETTRGMLMNQHREKVRVTND